MSVGNKYIFLDKTFFPFYVGLQLYSNFIVLEVLICNPKKQDAYTVLEDLLSNSCVV